MKIITLTISIALILDGLYSAISSYIGYTGSIETCQNYHCSMPPVFPIVNILIGCTMLIMGLIFFIVRNRLKEFINYKIKLKTIASILLIIVGSWLHLAITQPCKNPIGFMCDYSIGFPISFWLVTDFMDMFLLIHFLIGAILDFAIWYILLSFIFYVFRKATLPSKY